MAQKPGDIVIARHGRPSVPWKGWMSATGWDDWLARYEASGLVPNQTPPADLVTIARHSTHLMASTRPRAMETAKWLAPHRDADISDLFIEAHLPAPRLPSFMRFSPKGWGVICRTVWIFGYTGGGESAKLAWERTGRAADLLIEKAADGDVLLCAHGWFNRMLRRELKRRGWMCVRDGGDRYWSYRRFQPKDR